MSQKNARGPLMRDPEQGKVAGVCAGLANYFGYEVWLVRIAMFTGFIFTGWFFGPIFIAYVACWFIMDKKNDELTFEENNFGSSQYQSASADAAEVAKPIEVKTKVWQAGEAPRQALLDISRQFNDIESRMRLMETHVTSPEFTINSEIKKL